MIRSRWERVRDLFERAIDLDPQDAPAWVRREAADDAAVADEVLSLLQHHSRAGVFLSEPAAPAGGFDEAPPLRDGAAVGPYSIVREIGRGGMGHVYLALDTRLGRTVALKALPPSVSADDRQRERLRREARAAALLTHPGICTVYALEEIDGDLYIASEYIEGESLRAAIDGAPRPDAGRVERAFRELAEALAAAHRRGVVHRDLKPENVMQTRDGRMKVLDFGLALVGTTDDERMTKAGAVLGTPAYMAPEQLAGGEATTRSDVFALGLVVSEYATGTHPFAAATPIAVAARVLETVPDRLAERRGDLPEALVAIIERCLAREPLARFADATQLVQAMAAPAPALARHADAVTSWWRRHQLATIALYACAVALAWQIKEWIGGPPRFLFIAIGVLAATAGVFRGHLLFAERVNRTSFRAERRRAVPITMTTDLTIALLLGIDGLFIANDRQVFGVVTLALAVGLALARLVVERATASGAFGDDTNG